MVMRKGKKCREYFFLIHDRVRIYIHILQYHCNPSLNCNEKYKQEIGHDSNTLRESNQSTKSIKIDNIDSNQ